MIGLLRQIRASDSLVVMNLHQISPHSNPYWPAMHPRVFEDLLLFVKKHFRVVLFRELEQVAAESSPGKPPAILSFDDGYYDFIEYAAPLLDKHKLTANMNVIPACIESGEPTWNVQLYDFLNAAPKTLIDEIRLLGFADRLAGENLDAKVRYGLSISRYLKNRPCRQREELWKRIQPLMQKADFPRTRMMARCEVLEISGRHEVGVHSFSHESMEFESDDFFADDLEKCRNYFQNTLRLPLDIYAFPNGSFRPAQIETLRRSGIRYALLVGEDYAQSRRDVFPRFTIYGETPAEVRLRAIGFDRGRREGNRLLN
jgi:peptidoglycan/xylan/chitin deacetylase (PgdA/CDA1 family)